MRRIYEPRAYTEAPRAQCAWTIDRDWPRLEGDARADVAVIGGGYTGLSAALHLAEAGLDVALLEAEVPGFGASGRNGGFCCIGGARLGPGALARRYGARAAEAFFDTQREAIDLVAELTERHGIDVSRHSDGELIMAHDRGALRELDEEAAWFDARGIGTRRLDLDEMRTEGLTAAGTHGALQVRLGFGLDPGAYVTGLARAAKAAGVRIFGHSPVTRIGADGAEHRLETPTGTLTAPRLILATNGYSSDDVPPWLSARYLPVQSNVMVTRPLTEDEQRAQGWWSDLMAYDSRELLHYLRLMPDGRFLFGMRGNVRAKETDDAMMRARIRRDFAAMFPAWAEAEAPHMWSGLVCMSRSLVPYAGPLGAMTNAWTGLAYHGNGVAMGTMTGRILAQMAMGRASAPVVMRTPLGKLPLGRYRRLLIDASYRWYRLKDAL